MRVKQAIHPNIVPVLHIEGRTLELGHVDKAPFFIVLYLSIATIAALMITLTGVQILEAFTGTVAAMGNVGPGLGSVGSMGNYNALPTAAKYILGTTMLLGRLEIFGFILLFSGDFWRK